MGIKRLTYYLPLLLATTLLSCEMQDFGEMLENADADIRWSIAARHFTQEAEVNVPDDGSYIESRNPADFIIIATLPAPVDPALIAKANVSLRGIDEASVDIFPDYAVTLSGDQRRVRVSVTGLPNQARYRVQLRNNDGTLLGEAVFGRLVGDVDGDGTVGPLDGAIISALILAEFDASSEMIVRSDLDCNRLITNADQTLFGSNNGETLTAPVP